MSKILDCDCNLYRTQNVILKAPKEPHTGKQVQSVLPFWRSAWLQHPYVWISSI